MSELKFTDADAEGVRFPHHDSLVISTMIGNHLVHRCLIDDDSSVDILYPEESIELAVSFGEEPTRSTTVSNFMVVKSRSSYNAILGCPTLMAMKAVTFIYHLCQKFPTPGGAGVIRGNQYEVRMCYTTSVRSAPADPRGKQTAVDAGLAEGETLTIKVTEAHCELDPRLSVQ